MHPIMHLSLSHHGVESQGVEAPGRPGGVAAVPEVLELLLGLVEHLDALQVLLLQLLELQRATEDTPQGKSVKRGKHTHTQRRRIRGVWGREGRN